MRNATLDLETLIPALDRLASLAESWLRADIYAPEVAAELVNELCGLGMTLDDSIDRREL